MIPLGEILARRDPASMIQKICSQKAPFNAVEIGFGNGEFLQHAALERPDGFFFCIEVSINCVMKALKRTRRSSLSNVRLLLGDARFLLNECFPEDWLDAVYMNFPCPWPKSRHAKRRVTSRGFGDALAGVLKIGGAFELVTDDERYAEDAAITIPSHPAIEMEAFEADPLRKVRTKYERKWLEAGRRIYLLRFRKERSFRRKTLGGGVEELHKALERPCPELRELSALTGREGGQREARWVFRDCYINPAGVVLLETLTSDEGFEQSFFFRIVPRGLGCMVKVDPSTRPFTTPSVSGAFQEVVSFLGGGEP